MNGRGGISKARKGKPKALRRRIPNKIREVFKTSASNPHIEDSGNFILWFAINKNRGRGKGSPVGKGIRMERLEKGNMKGGVDAHVGRELKPIRMGRDLDIDGKRSQAYVIELGRWARGVNKSTEEPDKLTRGEGGKRGTTFIIVTSVGNLGPTEDVGQKGMEMTEMSMVGLCTGINGGGRSREVGKSTGVVTVGQIERGGEGGGVDGIIVSKFCMR